MKFVNRVKMNTATTGTGTLTLGAPVVSFQSFAAGGVADGDAVRYCIEDGINWEIGRGVYAAAGPTLTRVVEESSNAGAAIVLSGAAEVFVIAAAKDLSAGGLFNATRSATINSVTGDGTVYAVPFDTVQTAADFASLNTGTGEVTVNDDGLYLFHGSARVEGAAGANYEEGFLFSAGFVNAKASENAGAGSVSMPNLVTPIYLNKGAKLQFLIQVSGGALGNLNAASLHTFLRLAKISG